MSSRAPSLVVVTAVLALLTPLAAQARCTEGMRSSCLGRGGCAGIRQCNSGYMTGCICTAPPVACRVCNRQSFEDANGVCRPLPEVCNGCDDDGDGAVDEGLSCVVTGPFTPVCLPTGVLATIPIRLASDDLPRSPQGSGYANNISYRARIHTNPLVDTLELHYGVRAVDPFDTFFSFNRGTGAIIDEHGPDGTSSFYPLRGAGLSHGIELTFATDAVMGGRGFVIDGAKVTCGAQGSPGAAVLEEDGAETFGVLTATDDVVHFAVPVSGESFSVWLDGLPVAGFDADLYARFDQPPERDRFDFSSRNGGHSEEWISVDDPSPGRTLFIAVHSRSGSGAFNLRWARVKAKHRWQATLDGSARPLRVGLAFVPSGPDLGQINTLLAGGQRAMIGLTEGKVQVRQIDFFTSEGSCSCGGQGCDVCIHNTTGRASCAVGTTLTASNFRWSTPTQIFFFGSRTLVHEWGHCLLGLDDEYRDHGGVLDGSCIHTDHRCTHSAMGGSRITANLCNAFDHGRDPSPVGHVCSTCPNQVSILSGQSCTVATCNACFISGSSDWQDLLKAGHVFSTPMLTPNHRTYETFRGMPFTIRPR